MKGVRVMAWLSGEARRVGRMLSGRGGRQGGRPSEETRPSIPLDVREEAWSVMRWTEGGRREEVGGRGSLRIDLKLIGEERSPPAEG